jgi:hypothetical protein
MLPTGDCGRYTPWPCAPPPTKRPGGSCCLGGVDDTTAGAGAAAATGGLQTYTALSARSVERAASPDGPGIVSSAGTITSHHIQSHPITSNHITSHHITSHHVTSHHITSHHIRTAWHPSHTRACTAARALQHAPLHKSSTARAMSKHTRSSVLCATSSVESAAPRTCGAVAAGADVAGGSAEAAAADNAMPSAVAGTFRGPPRPRGASCGTERGTARRSVTDAGPITAFTTGPGEGAAEDVSSTPTTVATAAGPGMAAVLRRGGAFAIVCAKKKKARLICVHRNHTREAHSERAPNSPATMRGCRSEQSRNRRRAAGAPLQRVFRSWRRVRASRRRGHHRRHAAGSALRTPRRPSPTMWVPQALLQAAVPLRARRGHRRCAAP